MKLAIDLKRFENFRHISNLLCQREAVLELMKLALNNCCLRYRKLLHVDRAFAAYCFAVSRWMRSAQNGTNIKCVPILLSRGTEKNYRKNFHSGNAGRHRSPLSLSCHLHSVCARNVAANIIRRSLSFISDCSFSYTVCFL